MGNRTIEFWYDFASTYSYLAAERIGLLAKSKGIEVTWHPFLLGPIFQDQGWNSSPFNIYKAKGDYMWLDMARCAENYGLPFFRSTKAFPQNGLLAARIALCLPDGESRGEFTKAVYRAEFVQGKDITELNVIEEILIGMGHDSDILLLQTKTQAIKEKLFTNTAEARTKGIFGAPSFITASGELFWGDDRLEQALNWSVK